MNEHNKRKPRIVNKAIYNSIEPKRRDGYFIAGVVTGLLIAMILIFIRSAWL